MLIKISFNAISPVIVGRVIIIGSAGEYIAFLNDLYFYFLLVDLAFPYAGYHLRLHHRHCPYKVQDKEEEVFKFSQTL